MLEFLGVFDTPVSRNIPSNKSIDIIDIKVKGKMRGFFFFTINATVVNTGTAYLHSVSFEIAFYDVHNKYLGYTIEYMQNLDFDECRTVKLTGQCYGKPAKYMISILSYS